jgi:hypothetical protein
VVSTTGGILLLVQDVSRWTLINTTQLWGGQNLPTLRLAREMLQINKYYFWQLLFTKINIPGTINFVVDFIEIWKQLIKLSD